jgi:putative phosphonate catabolism associated alcohol dehydrogenase
VSSRTLAAIWRGGQDITVESMPLPVLRHGEILVRVRLATVCGSDRHTVSGRRSQPCPSILGHEAVGQVVALGPGAHRAVDGRALTEGQRVIWSVTLPCGTCDRCRSGVTAKCRTVRKAGHEAIDSGWALSGGYARHVLLPRGLPIAIVDDLPDAVAAPASCATSTVMAAVERAGSVSGRRVTVIGAGMLGLAAIAASADAGAAAVFAVDPSAARRALAQRFGATAVAPAVDDAAQTDVLLEFSGSSAALHRGIATLDVQGVAVLAGAVAPDGAVDVDPETIVQKHLSLVGVHNYEPRHLVAALAFLGRTRDRFPWAELVDPPRPLEEIATLLNGSATTAPRSSIAP